MSEQWKDIDGYGGLYQVSDQGRVRSWKVQYNAKDKNVEKPRILKELYTPSGYVKVGLRDKNTNFEQRYIHRLVAEAFIPNPEDKPTVNHRDFDKENNYVNNLEWATYSENNQHAHDNGRYPKRDMSGTKNGNNKLSPNDVLDMRNAYRLGCFTYKEIANAWDVSISCVAEAITGVHWSHL